MPMPKVIQDLKEWWWDITDKKMHAWWWSLTETRRQQIQQPLHIVMAFAVVALLHLAMPIIAALIVAVVVLGYREYLQWPSARPHDPVLDITAQFIGVMLAQGWYW